MQKNNPYLIHPPAVAVPSQPSANHASKGKRLILGILGVLALLISAGLGVTLVERQQIFSGKAASDTTAARIAEIAKEIGQKSNPNISSYASKKLGYQLSFDKNYWSPIDSDFTNPDLSKITLSLNDKVGNAKVTFSAFDLNSKIKNTKVGADNLDLLARVIMGEAGAVSHERVNIKGIDYEKLTYNVTFLGKKSQYFEYLAINGNVYYTITVKYSSFGSGASFSNQLIGSFSFLPLAPSVKAASTDAATVTALDESKIVELTKPSVFEIAHLFCNEINIPNLSGTKFLKPSYIFCGGGIGSGFAVNKDGYIATNGHVAKNYPEAALVQAFSEGSESVTPFGTDLLQELVLVTSGEEITPEMAKASLKQAEADPAILESLLSLIYGMLDKNVITLKENQNRYFVKLGSDPMVIDTTKQGTDILNAVTPSTTIKEAAYVASNFPNLYTADAVIRGKIPTGSDVAIIKITSPENLIFPSVRVGAPGNLKEGSDILIMGYPGLVSGSNAPNSLLNQQSSAAPTVTRGIISALKNDQGGLRLIQVDASIDRGNSGGPAFDTLGNVIGIATYGVESASGNFNFLRDVEDLKKLAAENSVTMEPSSTFLTWSQGLNYFWIQHYRQANVPFEQVRKDYPIHPLAATYISDSETAIQKGQDKSDFLFLLQNDRKTQIMLGGGTLLFAALGGALIFTALRKRSSQIPQIHEVPHFAPPVTYQAPIPHPNGPMTNPI